MSDYTHLKQYYPFEETFEVYLEAKSQLHPSRFSEDITNTPKVILSTCRKRSCLSQGIKSTSSFMFF